MKLIRQTLLRFKKGKTSDKVYEVDLVETSGDYLVNFRYGKYGANLREGSKTKSSVSLSEATKIADSLLVSKINKDYNVIKGYDPINKITVDEQSKRRKGSSGLSRDQKIIARLEKFNESKEKNIDGYELGRTLWKAGELRIKEAVPAIKQILINDKFSKDALDYYSILWALGRTADETVIPLIDTLAKKLPDNTEYMLTEIKMALSSISESPPSTPVFGDDIDLLQTALKVAQYSQIEQMSFDRLSNKEKGFSHHVLILHGIKEDVENAAKKLVIEDAVEDYSLKYLSKKSIEIIQKNEAAYPQLSDAIEKLFKVRVNALILKRAEKYKPDFDLYQSFIAKIDLNAVFKGSSSGVSYAEQGKLDWLWGNAEKDLRHAIKIHHAKVGSLWYKVIKYTDLISDVAKILTDDQVKHYQVIVKEADVFDDVMLAINKFSLDDYQWSFLDDNLSDETKSKYECDIDVQVIQVFDDQFYHLKIKALKPKKALLEGYQNSMLSLYRASVADKILRHKVLGVIRQISVQAPFTQMFRRLYKIAEFRDDWEVVAILNYRIEATPPTSSNYYNDVPKPFAKSTKEYFRRRMVRTLKNTAKFQPESYLQYAMSVLLQADDKDERLAIATKKGQSVYFPRLSAFNFILHTHSRAFTENYLGIWHFKPRTKEIERPEAYPELWDQAEGELLDLLLNCKAGRVNDFAFNKFNKKMALLDSIEQSDWIKLVQRPYENIALLALEYLQEALMHADVMIAILASTFKAVRKKVLDVFDGELLGDNLDLLVLMLLSEHKDVCEFAKSYLYTAKAHYMELSDRLLLVLIGTHSTQPHYLAQVEWLLLHPLKAKVSLTHITILLAKPAFEYQLLASKLLEASACDFNELAESYGLMSKSTYPEIRAGAISLLAKLFTNEKIQHKALLFSALVDENPALRQKSRKVIAGIDHQDFRIETFGFVLPEFFKAEPVDGFSNDMLELVVILKPMHIDVDINLLWRLLNAKSKLAEWVGALILPARKADEFSVKQLAMLTKNTTLSVRDWALAIFEADLSLTHENFSEAIRLLDNRWDDSRQRAIEFFQKQFDASFWNSQKTIAVCDNVYPDVQRFGRDLVTRFFNEDQGEEYLIKLSQHPSANVQLFVSGFLDEYASNQEHIILSLQPYFTTALTQVNRGRIIKDRIIHFLFDEAQKNNAVASMVAELFGHQSISMVIADKMQYIKTLFKLQTQFTEIQTPVVIIEPEVRAI